MRSSYDGVLPYGGMNSPSWNEYDHNNRQKRLQETDIGARWERFGRTRRVIAKTALALGLSSSIIAATYMGDVYETKAQLAQTHPSIEITAQPEHQTDSHRLIIGIGGFGTTSAESAMKALPYERIGLEATLNYDKKGIDTTVIKNEIVTFAKQHGIDQIIFSGHSMGGDVALEVASLLHIDPDAPEVSDIILDCTPPNLSALQPNTRRAGDYMLAAMAPIPGHRDSRYLRGIGEMTSRYSAYANTSSHELLPDINIKEFIHEFRDVQKTKLDDNAGSVGLVEDQYKRIVLDGARASFERLGKSMPDKRTPIVYFLRPRQASADGVVNIDRAVAILTGLGKEFTIPVLINELDPGTNHANPGQAPKEYGALLVSTIFPSIQSQYDDYTRYKRRGDILIRDATPPVLK